MGEFKEDLRSEELAGSQGRSQSRVLRTAANGMQVWVPADRLEEWEKAQADQSPEAKERRSLLSSAIMSRLSSMRGKAPES